MSVRGALAAILALLAGAQAGAQTPATDPPGSRFATPAALEKTSHRLWPGRAPGATGDTAADTPTVTVYRPQQGRANGTAVVIAPGGGYLALASVLEGEEPASWFTARGITAFVLTYRVGKAARMPTVLLDGARAIRFVRANAAAFAVDPARIGMMGFSAGGHLAASTAVGATAGRADDADPVERVGSRPDFLILAYPWLEGTRVLADGTSQYCDFASRAAIPCRPADYAGFLPVRRVGAATPPTFLYHTTDDELVPVGGSTRFHEALVAAGVPAELHAFASGRHGSGLGGSDPALSRWPDLLDAWLRARGLIRTPAP